MLYKEHFKVKIKPYENPRYRDAVNGVSNLHQLDVVQILTSYFFKITSRNSLTPTVLARKQFLHLYFFPTYNNATLNL